MLRYSRALSYRMHYSRIDKSLSQPAVPVSDDYLGSDQYQDDVQALRETLVKSSFLNERMCLAANQLVGFGGAILWAGKKNFQKKISKKFQKKFFFARKILPQNLFPSQASTNEC